jgi:hypothetical protein
MRAQLGVERVDVGTVDVRRGVAVAKRALGVLQRRALFVVFVRRVEYELRGAALHADPRKGLAHGIVASSELAGAPLPADFEVLIETGLHGGYRITVDAYVR